MKPHRAAGKKERKQGRVSCNNQNYDLEVRRRPFYLVKKRNEIFGNVGFNDRIAWIGTDVRSGR